MSSAGAYRADIDGLRAFAVLSVVCYHAFPSLLPGGFVGVDVFFVISGFLISGIIFKSLQEGDFSFSDFYARRVKRIFPALILVLVASFALAWFVLFDNELKQLGNHLLRASAFLSNFILWHESGYFDNAAETKPLLHLWSLAIEEQFYIVWPLIIWGLWRLKTWRWQLMCGLAIASFAWNVYQSQHDLTHDFYSPLTRFWELLCGALLAYRTVMFSVSEKSAEWRAALGVALLLLSVACIDAEKRFPGAWALMPVMGAVLILSANGQAWISRIVFANRFIVWVGTISYPLYLWHWPIFSYARIIEGSTPSVEFRLAALCASVALAWLTFKWVEKPIRFGLKLRYKTSALVVGMLAIGALGYSANKTHGFPNRMIMGDQQVVRSGDIDHDVFHSYHGEQFFKCADSLLHKDAAQWRGVVRCFQSHKTKPVSLFLLGDSHAEHLFIGIAQELPHVNVGFSTKVGLPLLSNADFKVIFDHVLNNADIKQVVITAMWASRMGEVKKGHTLASELTYTIQALQTAGKKVYLSDHLPQFSFDPQRCKYLRPFTEATKCDESRENLDIQRAKYLADLQEVVRLSPDVEWIEISFLMCEGATCSMDRDGQLLFRDNNHLNIPGSQFVGAQIVTKHPELAR
jgi:peptidoglycan/LPS O-acetylase OafA/YrhL